MPLGTCETCGRTEVVDGVCADHACVCRWCEKNPASVIHDRICPACRNRIERVIRIKHVERSLKSVREICVEAVETLDDILAQRFGS